MVAPDSVTMISEYLYAALVLKNGETSLATKPDKSIAPALPRTPNHHAGLGEYARFHKLLQCRNSFPVQAFWKW